MPGILGYVNSKINKLDEMLSVVMQHENLINKFKYSDVYVKFAKVTTNIYENNDIDNENITVSLDGCCYNIEEIKEIFSLNSTSFTEIISFAYQNNILEKVLNKIDGCFNIFIYDKREEKILLINDRWSLKPLYIYNKNGDFAFSTLEMKPFFVLDFVDKTIDKNAFNVFIKLGHFLGAQTLFENVKQLNPSTILEFDLKNKTYNTKYYWTPAEIKKSDISFEDAVDRVHTLFCEAMRKEVDIKLLPSIPLSGGFDSRLIYSELKNMYPDYVPYTFTFGIKNCRDVVNAQKVLDLDKVQNHVYELNEANWYEPRKDILYFSDCTSTIADMHGLEFYKDYAEHTKLILSGYLGDTIFGAGYVARFRDSHLNKRADKELAQKLYGEYFEFSNYNDEFYNIENSLPFVFVNRGRNLILGGENIFSFCMEVVRPFFDNKVIEFVLSLPNEYLLGDKLYNHMVLKYYPKYFKNINRNSKRPIFIKKDLSYRINKFKFLLNEKFQKWGLIDKIIDHYVNYEKWIKEDFIISEFYSLLDSKTSLCTKVTGTDYLALYKDFLDNKTSDTREILNIVSLELYLRYADEFLTNICRKIDIKEYL